VKRNYWNVHRYKEDSSQLWDGAVDEENFRVIVDRVIERYFVQPNYYRLDGKPVFSIFSIQNLVESFGSLHKTREALDYFRQACIQAGYPGLHIQLIAFGSPGQEQLEQIEYLGVDSVTKYNWGGPHPEDYLQWGKESGQRRERWAEALDIPYFSNVSIGWDDSPRFPHKGRKDLVHYHKSPEAFAAFLQHARYYCDSHPEQRALITIFSWNEWIEGGYLLPDMKHGFSYLEAVQSVLNGSFDPYSSGE